MSTRALIVDDEPLARERLRQLLSDQTDIEVVGECGSGTHAIESISGKKPELVFLDIELPDVDGFGVVDAIDDQVRPVIIFVTAHDASAARAFNTKAEDYLLKPIGRSRFCRALERGREACGVLTRNLEDLGLEPHAEVLATDALSPAARAGGPWDVVFYDPPYPLLDAGAGGSADRDAVLAALAALVRGPLAPDGVLVFHAPAGSVPATDLPSDLEAALKTYGTTDIWFVGRGEDEA